ncbi:MAG: universal stress protein [bacterium]
MVKNILITTDGSQYSSTALEYAVFIAKRSGATIRGLYVIDIRKLEGPFLRDVSGAMGLVPYVEYQNRVEAILRDVGEDALAKIRGRCEGEGIPCDVSLRTGIVPNIIAEEARTADLLVMGKRGEHSQWGGILLGHTLESVVRHTKTTILITPEEYKEISKILITYDGSEYACRALRAATQFASENELPITVLMVADNESEGATTMAGAVRYLESYALQYKTLIKSGDVTKRIMETAQEEGCNLIAMGAYGHSRIRELILGSTTDQVMRKTNLPLLLHR